MFAVFNLLYLILLILMFCSPCSSVIVYQVILNVYFGIVANIQLPSLNLKEGSMIKTKCLFQQGRKSAVDRRAEG